MKMKENPVIVISRTDRIGDLVLSIPSFRRARDMFPGATITVLVRSYNFDIVKNLSYIDRVIQVDQFSERDLLKELRRLNPDFFISLFDNSFISRLARRTGARYRVGPLSTFISFFTYNRGLLQKRSRSIKNEAEYNLDIIRQADKENFSKNHEIDSKIYIGETNTKFVQEFFEQKSIVEKDEIVVIHPFSGGSAHNLTVEQYGDLLVVLAKQLSDSRFIVSAGITEIAHAEAFFSNLESDRIHIFKNKGSILNLAALLEKASLYIGGSTGPTHIAASFKVKIAAFYPHKKTMSPIRWGVFNHDNVFYVQPQNEDEDSFDNIDISQVADRIVTFLDIKSKN